MRNQKRATGKPAGPAKKTDRIVIDVRTKKNYSSLVSLLKRKVSAAPATPLPEDLKPMLATLVDEPFTDGSWQFELKLDGYRALAYLKKGSAEIRSRNNLSFNKKFAAVHEALEQWPIDAVLDGEIVVLNDEGVPDFNGIQQWEKKQQGQLVYYVFDLLWLDGRNIMHEPLQLRRSLLKELVPDSGAIRFSDHIDEIGDAFFEIARKNNLEGIIAKKKDSTYIPDARSKSWLKIKVEERHEAIICGYTRKKTSDRLFSALLLGVYRKGKLEFLGQAGTGYSAASQKELMAKMKPLVTATRPFDEEPDIAEQPVWLRPHLVCEVKYTELTDEGVMRHASFQGLRADKTAADWNGEKTTHTTEALTSSTEEDGLDTSRSEQTINIDGHDLKLTNLKKIYWPKEKITKGSLLQYYMSVADYMMPYMKDRPQSLNRFPDGINGPNFYHKNMNGKVAPWIKTFERFSASDGEAKDFLICSDAATLVYMANLGCIEMNPWHSRVKSPLNPDWCVIDLDPGNNSFEQVIETALAVQRVLDALQVPSFPKTSGSTGLHIYIPLGARYNYDQSKQLAELIVNLVHEDLPQITSLERNPQKRKNLIYLDYLQNRPIQTICAPYSVRPKPGATVSMPLHWEEVKKGLKISDFTLRNALERLRAEGDLFAGVLGKGIDLNKILKGLASLI